MTSFKEKIKKDIINWEKEITRAKAIADKQKSEKKIMVYQKIYQLQSDMQSLKASLRVYIKDQKDHLSPTQPIVESNHEKVKQDIKALKGDIPEMQEPVENKSFDKILSKCCQEIKEDMNQFYSDTKELAAKSSSETKEKVNASFTSIGRKIDDLDIKMKDSWHSMSDSLKETSRNSLEKLKKKKNEMKEWCKKTNEEWFK